MCFAVFLGFFLGRFVLDHFRLFVFLGIYFLGLGSSSGKCSVLCVFFLVCFSFCSFLVVSRIN